MIFRFFWFTSSVRRRTLDVNGTYFTTLMTTPEPTVRPPSRTAKRRFSHAYERFHSFPPDDVDFIEGWSRKRDGDSQMILLHLATEAHMQDFLALCRQEERGRAS